MQKKYLRTISIAIFCISFACVHVKEPYILSHLPQIEVLEKQDHQFCDELKLNFDRTDAVRSSLYWRCRLSLAKYKLYTDTSIPENARHNLEISDLIGKISLKLAETPESILTNENKKMDSRQHKKCVAMGFSLDTEDQIKIDDYFACRKALIEDQQLVPPFTNLEYLKYPNRSYNIGFVIGLRVDEKMKKYKAAQEKYPTCVKFNLLSIDFKNCTKAQDSSRQCFAEMDKNKFKKELEEKIICQKLAYTELPDKLLKKNNQEEKDLERMKNNSDYYNKSNFTAIGIDDITDFDADDDRVIALKEKEAKEKDKKKNINSKSGLYDKFELTRLRQRYIASCQKEAESRVTKYMEDLKNSCEKMAEFEKVAE
jgi:hypothetical protein